MEYIKGYYLMPHPPIILPEVGKGEERKIQQTIDACQAIAKEVKEQKPETIIIITPHGVMFSDAIALMMGEKATGDLSQFNASSVKINKTIDIELTNEIMNRAEEMNIPYVGVNETNLKHFSREYTLDHGAIVPLAFIEKEYQDYQLVHITYSFISDLELYKFGVVIKDAIEKTKRNAVIIASGDLSHRLTEEGPYEYSPKGKVFDETFVDLLKEGDILGAFEMDKALCEEAGECGLRSAYILLGSINSHFTGEVLSYEGPLGVGYGVIKFMKKEGHFDYLPYLVNTIYERKLQKINHSDEYVKLARKSIEHYLKTNKYLKVPEHLPQELMKEKAGVFVSLKKYGNLRGCIGTFLPTRSNIAEEIINNAVEAAFDDPRFSKLTEEELLDIEVSVDVLSKPVEATKEELDPKEYGVIVRQGMKRGLLLPDLEGVHSIDEQLSIACQKAGIKPNGQFDIQKFSVIRHREGELNG